MNEERYLAIRRDDRFSPNSVEADRLILQAVCDEIEKTARLKGHIRMIDEAGFAQNAEQADVYISMARAEETLEVLREQERKGARVFNCTQGVRNCRRSLLDNNMRKHGFSMPAAEGDHGYWLKRGDAAAQSKADVVFCKDAIALEEAKKSFYDRAIYDLVVSAHVPGDLIKFYGVGERMFRYFYPGDDGISKFGDEAQNGEAHHYAFDESALEKEIVKLSRLTQVAVYGGDAIVDAHGKYYIIDFNDWPGFSRCRAEAAKAIAAEIMGR